MWLARVGFFVLLCSLAAAQTLRQAADRAGMLIGAGVNAAYLSSPLYTLTLAREFNMLEPGDALKWEALRPNEQTYDFSTADKIGDFAHQQGMRVRGHTLVWGRHNPAWLENGRYSPEQLSRLLKLHIQTVVGRYRGRVFAWDVVNEAFDENGQLRDSIWMNRPGIGLIGGAYIEQALRWAHEADPKALLFINDAEGEAINAKSDAIYAMVKDFKARGVPIDGVGLQMHILDLHPDVASIAANIERLVRLGVQVHITEMDVAVRVDGRGEPLDPMDLDRQAEIYRRIVGACLRSPGCKAIQTWGFTDKDSWIGWYTQGKKGAALPFDRSYRPKAAYKAMRNTLRQASGR